MAQSINYGDLYDSLDLPTDQSITSEQVLHLSDQVNKLQAQISEQQTEIKQLSNEKKILIRNISRLYATAKNELDRKNAEIQRLRTQITK